MPSYRVSGYDRQAGAIGAAQPFTIIIEVNTPSQVTAKTRAQRYKQGRDNVHIDSFLIIPTITKA